MSNFNYRWGRVCKLWHVVSCRPELWKSVDLAQYTTEKCKTDYKLVWLLENRLSQCQSLNIGKKQLNILVVTTILNRRLKASKFVNFMWCTRQLAANIDIINC